MLFDLVVDPESIEVSVLVDCLARANGLETWEARHLRWHCHNTLGIQATASRPLDNDARRAVLEIANGLHVDDLDDDWYDDPEEWLADTLRLRDALVRWVAESELVSPR